MTLESSKTEWYCEVCGAQFASEDAAWDHWLTCLWTKRPDRQGQMLVFVYELEVGK